MSSDRHSFAQELRSIRTQRDLTLAALADSSGLSLTHISNLELGRRAPSPEHAEALAVALALHPAERRHWLMQAGLAHVPPGLREAVVAALRES